MGTEGTVEEQKKELSDFMAEIGLTSEEAEEVFKRFSILTLSKARKHTVFPTKQCFKMALRLAIKYP